MHWFGIRCYDTKLILWTLFIIQLLLIGVFWMLQNITSNDDNLNNLSIVVTSSSSSSSLIAAVDIESRLNHNENENRFSAINFIKSIQSSIDNSKNHNGNKLIKLKNSNDGNELFYYHNPSHNQQIEIKLISNFSKDFITFKTTDNHDLICYREGITTGTKNTDDNDYNDNNDINIINNGFVINQNKIQKCECKTEWHGKDCGQPEIIWRALMTSKLPLKITNIPNLNPNKIIYMIIGNFLSIELLEIQIMELINIVDFFIICRKNLYTSNSYSNNNNNKNDNSQNNDNSKNMMKMMIMTLIDNYQQKQKRLKLNFIPDEYKNRFFIIDNYYYNNNNNDDDNNNKNNYYKHLNNCTPKFIYKEFLKNIKLNNNTNNNNNNNNENPNDKLITLNNTITKNLNSNDIFLLSYDNEILNYKSIKYFKYYDKLPSKIIRFRLKYNVYGFFWQHPENTYLGSYGCNIEQLNNLYKMDPERMINNNNNKNQIIIGDLNHYGGWYCKYCYQPNEIIERLQIDALSSLQSSSSSSSFTSINSSSPSSSSSLLLSSIFPKNSKNQQIDVSYIQNLIASGLYVDGKLGLIKLHKYSDKYYIPNYVNKYNWKFNNIISNLYLSYFDDGDDYI